MQGAFYIPFNWSFTMTFTSSPFTKDAPEAQRTHKLPQAPQLRTGVQAWNAARFSKCCCSSCAKSLGLSVRQGCPVRGGGVRWRWQQDSGNFAQVPTVTTSDQGEESMQTRPSQPGRKGVCLVVETCQGAPRRQMAGSQARTGQEEAISWFPGAAEPAITFCGGAAVPCFTSNQLLPELLVPGECLPMGPCFSVTTEWGWHCSVLRVTPILS